MELDAVAPVQRQIYLPLVSVDVRAPGIGLVAVYDTEGRPRDASFYRPLGMVGDGLNIALLGVDKFRGSQESPTIHHQPLICLVGFRGKIV